MRIKRDILISAMTLTAALAMAACSTAGGGTPEVSSTSPGGASASDTSSGAATTADYMAPAKSGPYKVAFADSWAGNTWRAQVHQEFDYACSETYKSDVTCLPATDANNDLATQVSQITDFISQGVDILLVNAADAAGLNQVIEQAHNAGIQVVDFDNNTTSDYAIHVGEDQTQIGYLGGQWLASQLKSGDKIIVLDGITGNPTSDQRKQGAEKALKEAGIEMVASADTSWDKATAQTAAASLLAANPDIQGIYSQGGDASLGAIAAMQQLGMTVLPIPGEASNGFLKTWQSLAESQPGFTSWAFASPPQLVVKSLDVAIKALQGTDPGQTVYQDIPTITADNLADYVRPDLNDSLWLPTLLPDSILQKSYAN